MSEFWKEYKKEFHPDKPYSEIPELARPKITISSVLYKDKETHEWKRCKGWRNMSEGYFKLIKDIFGDEYDIVALPEEEFIKLLPEIGMTSSERCKWRGERISELIMNRYGLAGRKSHTYKQCGEIAGVGAQRIRQVITKTLRLLRHPERIEQYIISKEYKE